VNSLDGEAWCRLKGQRFLNVAIFPDFTLYYNAIEKKKTGSTTNLFLKLFFITYLCILELQTKDLISLGAWGSQMVAWSWTRWPTFDPAAIGWLATTQYKYGDGITCIGFKANQPESAATFPCVNPKRIICH
jgi:hypothetical protein